MTAQRLKRSGARPHDRRQLTLSLEALVANRTRQRMGSKVLSIGCRRKHSTSSYYYFFFIFTASRRRRARATLTMCTECIRPKKVSSSTLLAAESRGYLGTESFGPRLGRRRDNPVLTLSDGQRGIPRRFFFNTSRVFVGRFLRNTRDGT